MRCPPFAVAILPYAVELDGAIRYAVSRTWSGHERRSWRVLPGCGRRGEPPLEAARREALRIAAVPPDAAYLALDSCAALDSDAIPGGLPHFAFGVRVCCDELRPQGAQLELRWVTYEIADGLLWHEAERSALWELRRRLGHPAALR